MSSRILAALAGACALALAACDPPCPSQPSTCSSSATLSFVLEGGVPEAYEVRVRLIDDAGVEQEDRCLLIAPLPADWPSSGITATCAKNAVSLYIQPVFDSDCDINVTPGPGVQVGAECKTTIQRSDLVLRTAGKPKTIELELSRGGVPFEPLVVTPTYADWYPDGEHCSARCPVASESRSFDELVRDD